jgi:mRNA interferase RelE/StbE
VTYTVEILRAAQTQLAKIAKQDRGRIIAAIRSLANVPRPHGCKKLSGRSAWRIRVGTYRVLYEIHDDRLVVVVITLGHRKDVYRN